MAHVERLAVAPRPTGSPAHAAALADLTATLDGLGLATWEERSEDPPLTNLVAGEGSGGVWLVAHSDSVRAAPGAADDGLGLGVVLEAARALTRTGAAKDLHVLITDGEEKGLLGARSHVQTNDHSPRLVLNVEARGASGPIYMFQLAGPTAELLGAWRAGGCTGQTSSLARYVYDSLPNDTDFSVFRRVGWAGYDFALIHDAWRYHTVDDVPAGLDPRSVQQAGDCVVGLARAWLGRPAPTAEPGPSLAWQQLTTGLVVVPAVVVRGVGATLLAGLLLLRGRRIAPGVAAWSGALAVAWAGGVGIVAALSGMDGWDRPAEIVGAERVYGGAMLLGVASAGGVWAVARRWGPAPGWHAVAVLLAGGVALAVPEVGYALLPGGVVALAAARGRALWAAPFAMLAGLVLAPLLHAFPAALTSHAAPVLTVLPLLFLGWLAPPADR